MQEMIKKSIFVGATKVYYPIFRTKWFFGEYGDDDEEIRTAGAYVITNPLMECNKIKTINIPMPLLAVGDDFYFEDTNEIVNIERVMRTSEDNVVYVVFVKTVADEETKSQYEKEKQVFLDVEQLRSENDKLQKELKDTRTLLKELYNRGLFARIKNK